MLQELKAPKITYLESVSDRIERFLSTNGKRPNFIKRNLYNALNWNVVAVLDSAVPEKNEIERSYHFGDRHFTVDPKFSFYNKLRYLIRPDLDFSTKLEILKKRGEMAKKWIIGMNQVTNDGEIGYANQAAEETPASNEDFFRTALSRTQLANPASQTAIAATDTWAEFDGAADAIAGSNKVFDAAYPKRNDGDSDNTGAGVDIVSFLTSYTTGDFNDGGVTIKNFAIHDNASPTDSTKLLTHGQIAAFNKTATDTLKFFVNHEMRRA